MANTRNTDTKSTTRNMKKRNTAHTSHTVNVPKSTKSEKNNYSSVDEIKEEPNEVVVDGAKVGISAQKFAQMFDFSALQNVLTQNVSKTVSKTYTQYTREKLDTYIQSPLSNLDNIRDVSQYIYRISPNYRTLISYYANMALYSYNISYRNPDWNKATTAKDFMQEYQNLASRLENMRLQDLSPQIIATCLRDGIYAGFTYDSEDSFFIQSLEPKYIKISGITENNTYILKMNMAYFDSGDNQDFLYGVNDDGENVWDDSFRQAYENYKADRNMQWAELDPTRTICIIYGEDPLVPLPAFIGIFSQLLDLLDYSELLRSKTELENTVLLLTKVPLLSGSNSVDDFAVSLDLIRMTQQLLDSAAPSLVATAWTPAEVEKITFDNNNQVQDNNVFSQAIQNLFESVGVSEMLFSSEKSGSVGLRHSIRVDESTVFSLMSRLEANIQRYIKLNITENFDFYFHKVTIFGQDDYISSLQNMATLGVPVKTDLATVTKTPFEMMNATFMENALGLETLWKPLSSSYTQSGESSGNTVTDSEISDEGADTRDSEKNEGTKASK